MQKTHKRKYSFDEEETASWVRPPKIDAPIAKMSKKASLPFEDAGYLQDPIDKKLDKCLRRTWESAAGGLKPNIASTCVARSLLVWLNQMEEHIKNRTSRDALLASIPTLKKAAAFLADASTDAIRFSAKSAALSNAARRALWIKKWSGDVNSKNRLCAIPCEGEYLFGSVLNDLLEKAGDKGKVFPNPYPYRHQFPFRGSFKRGQFKRGRQESNRARGSKRSRGFLFNQFSGTSR